MDNIPGIGMNTGTYYSPSLSPRKTAAADIPVSDTVQTGNNQDSPKIDLKKAARELFNSDPANAVKRDFSPCCISSGAPPVVQGPDGTIYLSGANKSLYAMEPDTGNLRWERTCDREASEQAVVSPDNKNVYFTAVHGSLMAIDTETGKERWNKFEHGFKWYTPPAVSDDGKNLYAGNMGKFICKLNAETGDEDWRFETGSAVKATPTLSPDGKTVFVEAENHTLYAIDTDRGEPRWELDLSMGFDAQTPVSPDGSLVYTGSWDKEIYGVNTADKSKTWTFTWKGSQRWEKLKIDLSPGGNSLAVLPSYREKSGESAKSDLIMLDAQTGEEKWTFKDAAHIDPAFSPDEKTVFTVGKDKKLHALDTEKGTESWSYSSPAGDLVSSAVSKDGSVVYATVRWLEPPKGQGMSQYASKLIAIDTRTGKERPEFAPGGIMTLEFEQDTGVSVYRRKKIDLAKQESDTSSAQEPVIEKKEQEVDIDGAMLKKRKPKF